MSTRRTLASLGSIMQMAYVPADFEATLSHWIEVIGAGPFFLLEHPKLQGHRYRGVPTNPDITVALGYCGEMQIEIIRQHNEAPSVFKKWRDANREGLHHVCVIVEEMGRVREACLAAGAELALEATSRHGGEIIYVDPGGPGPLIEFLAEDPSRRELYAKMHETHRTWDGSDPIRPLGR